MRKGLTITLASALVAVFTIASLQAAPPPERKNQRTVLGKYVTAKEAWEMWRTDKDKYKLLDVRSRPEYQLVGHAPTARNIPFKFLTNKWNPERQRFKFERNPDFEKHVKKYYKPEDTILVMCRFGGRSAAAVNAMAKMGYKNVYNILDSFEGGKVTDKDSYFYGLRMKNGWKNLGAPWGYENDPGLVYRPDANEGK